MKPAKLKLPQIPGSFQKEGVQLKEVELEALRQDIRSIKSSMEESSLKSIQYQAEHTQLLKQILASLNKSVKLQAGIFKVSKDISTTFNHAESKEEKEEVEDSIEKQDLYFSNKQQLKKAESVSKLPPKKPSQNRLDLKQKNSYQETEAQSIERGEFKSRCLVVLFQISNKQANIYKSISVWTGILYETLANSAFYGYYQTKQLSKEQAKLYFSRNLILNYLKLIEYLKRINPSFWKQNRNQILSHFNLESKKAVSFLKLKFPQKKKTFVNPQLANLIRSFDSMEQYDSFTMKQLQFFYDEDNLWAQLKLFLNSIIDQSKSSKQRFEQVLSELFVGQDANKEKYDLKYVIDTKLPKTTPKYTDQEINQHGLNIKSPQILRVIMKWIESFESLIDNIWQKPLSWYKVDHYDEENYQQCRDNIVNDFLSKKPDIYERIHLEQQELINISIDVTEHIQKCRESFKSIPKDSYQTGLFTSLMGESLTLFAGDFLYFLFKQFGGTLDDNKGLVFEIYDLLRARCQGTIEQIKAVYSNLSNSQNITIIRVKNRTSTNNRDFLINFLVTKGNVASDKKRKDYVPLICELQLVIIEGKSEQKQHYYDQFNHFLYELERSRYGAICEAVSIISNTDDSVSFFESSKINEQFRQHSCVMVPTRLEDDQIFYNDNLCTVQQFNFICTCCSKYVKSHGDLIPVSINAQTNEKICGRCVTQSLPSEQLTYLLLRTSQEENSVYDYFEQTRFGEVFTHTYQYFLKIKRTLPRTITAFKQYDGNLIQCMFGLTKDEYSQDENNQVFDESQQLKDNFLLGLKKSSKIMEVKSRELMKLLQKEKVIALEDIIQNPNLPQMSIHKLFVPEMTFVLVEITHLEKYLLIDVYKSNLKQKFQMFGQQKVFKSLFKKWQVTRANMWNLKGDYNEQIFAYFKSIKECPQIIECQLSLMTKFPDFDYPNLKKVKLELNQADLDFKKLLPCKMIENIQVSMVSGKCSFRGCTFNLLSFLFVKSQSLESIDFADLEAPDLKDIEINSKSVSTFLGFQSQQSPSKTSSITLKTIVLNLGSVDIDLRLLNTSKMTQFDLSNEGSTLYPKFLSQGVLKDMTVKSPSFDFGCLINSPVINLHLTGVKNINDVNQFFKQREHKHKLSLEIHSTTAKQIKFTEFAKLSYLEIANSLVESLVFQSPIQIHSLQITCTNIKELDLSLVNSTKTQNFDQFELDTLILTGNRLQKITFKDAKQVSLISTLDLGYNFYSDQFLENTSLQTSVWKSLQNVSIGCYKGDSLDKGAGLYEMLRLQLLKMSETEFNTFLEDIKENELDTSGITQQMIQLDKWLLKKYKIEKYDYGEEESVREINESYNGLRSTILQKLRFVDQSIEHPNRCGWYQKQTD